MTAHHSYLFLATTRSKIHIKLRYCILIIHIADTLQRVTYPLCNLSRNCFGLAMIAQSKLVLHTLQVAEYTLPVAITSNNLKSIQSKFHVIVAESGTEIYSVQFLQAERVARQVAKGYVTHCNLPATCLAKTLQHKLQRKLHRVTLAVKLDSTSCNETIKPFSILFCFFLFFLFFFNNRMLERNRNRE